MGDSDVAPVFVALVEGFEGLVSVLGGGPQEPLDGGRRVGAPHLAGQDVLLVGREGLQRTLDLCPLGWN